MPLIDFILHIDAHLLAMTQQYGVWIYAILFAIVFAETGLVVTPFLPGDSLLFAVGAIAALGGLDPWLAGGLIALAAFLGDNTNYFFGRWMGPRVFREDSRWLNRAYLVKTQAYYDRWGPQTVIIARFLPIIRTFAPFVAGVGNMPYRRFIGFSSLGSLLWVPSFIGLGYLFGNMPAVKKHFSLVVLAIIVISVMPAVIAVLNEWNKKRRAAQISEG
ncbi:DedA family protein [Permianibacter aggregans]|uniref:Membrane-associated protein n=1 Tax=Permianibacter aggregans TaxID=1510150 RepID=A0A4R6UVS7_9GAMM|nr:DedA family protein [Permianibacter aggregans]QGX41559.1 DedA family protein [Permianibacter aggregans]TDQ51362.1 membrane-associated protein [Permianibacter aggregans]